MSKSLITFYVTGDAAFKRRVKAEAARRGVEMSDLIRAAIEFYLESGDRRTAQSFEQPPGSPRPEDTEG